MVVQYIFNMQIPLEDNSLLHEHSLKSIHLASERRGKVDDTRVNDQQEHSN